MEDTEYLNHYYGYLDTHLNKSLNSFNTITNLSEIHRVLFNFCHLKNDKTTAMKFGLAEYAYNGMELLSEAMTYKEYTEE